MNFIKKVIGGSSKTKTDIKIEDETSQKHEQTPDKKSNNTHKEVNSSCVPPICPYVSKENVRSDLSLLKDFNSAYYYNYYRTLEKNNSSHISPGLRPSAYVSGNTFSLKEFNIVSEMNDSCVVSVWTQKYSNESSSPVEAIYQIPLAPYAAVSDFSVILKDKVLKGKIKENSKAKEKYNDAIASGGQAFLAEKVEGFFKLQIGNLPPQEDVTVNITITSEIGTHLESLHFCLHRFIFPQNSFKFNYTLNASLSTPIETIELDNYKPTITYKDESKTKATITISTDNGVKSNIIAIIVPKYSEKPESFIEFSPIDKSYAVALNFYPNFSVGLDEVDQKSEFVFVLDCSGSMSGKPIEKSKMALEICMRSLNENSKFNIVCFGSSFTKLFETSKHYNDETLEKASQYISRIDANLGGTELLEPIVDILSKESDPEYPRQVFILTDGEISNRDKLIDYVGKEANTTRIFTYGIGSYVDQELIVGVSKACKGYYEMIKENSDMEEKVMKLISIAMQPTLSNIKVNWGDLSVVQSPAQVRPLFNHERMMIYATLEKLPTEKVVTISLVGNGPLSDEISFPITLDFDKADSSSNHIHTLSAFKHIQDLEESERKEKKDNKDKIVKLGKKYGLVSKHTSYIVTSDSDKVTEETMKTVEVLEKKQDIPTPHPSIAPSPVFSSSITHSAPPPPRGCSQNISFNTCSMPIPVQSSSLCAPPPPPPCISQSEMCDLSIEEEECDEDECKSLSFDGSLEGDMLVEKECLKKECEQSSQQSQKILFAPVMRSKISKAPSSPSKAPSPPTPPSKNFSLPSKSSGTLIEIIRQQKANGSFTKSSVSNLLAISEPPSGIPEDVWTTLLIIANFIVNFDSQKSQWELVSQKATKFVKQQILKSAISSNFETLLESAKKSIAK
ncbi:hypothetical protein RB653_005267 [Dictyostelium firmibasis]|uniref:von Willebrand factor A domain-containing protein n=1 Tax=Dictyostelium firmibasis TaxID=79012 RepID=A0AAN7YSU3_9MYCE